MPKIQCPHCKAVNQDVSPDDPCWQCGTILNAPASAIETGTGPPTSEANPSDPSAAVSPAIQKQIDRADPQAKVPIEQRYKPMGPNVAVIAVSATILAMIIIAILFWLKVFHL